jgi:cell filamentation protein
MNRNKSTQTKISIRFFDDREVRAVWDDEQSKWWFSVLDVVGVLNEEPDYTKVRNYWKYLKAKFKKENNQLVSATTQLKITAADGKKYKSDMFDSEGIIELSKNFPNNKATKFLDWFLYSDNSIDGKSKKKAYTLFESNLINEFEVGTTKGLQQIHSYLFGGLYDFAGQIRQKSISKGGYSFVYAQQLKSTLQQIDTMKQSTLQEIVIKYVEMNKAHPFMEGNGRSTRIWLDMMLKVQLKKCVDWSKIKKEYYMNAMIISTVDSSVLMQLIEAALTPKINDRELFMKGIDYSYYYEE